MELAGQGDQRQTGVARGPGYGGDARAGVTLAVSWGGPDRRARAAAYSWSRARRPWKVPRHRHLRSRSSTLQTAWRQAGPQKHAGL
jgi:hypothetical protein